MKGLTGFVYGSIAAVVAFILCVLVGVIALFVGGESWRLFFAVLAAFITMLGFIALIYIEDRGWVDFQNSYYDTLGPVWIFAAVLIAIFVFIKI